jgi:putative FmdB family regulatory protein
MPLYEYGCEDCGHRFENYQSIREDSLVTCPKCAEDSLRRLISTPKVETEYVKPIEMHSIGMAFEEDIRDFKRKNPDMDCSEDPNDPLFGVPIARTRKQKLNALKSIGWEERK